VWVEIARGAAIHEKLNAVAGASWLRSCASTDSPSYRHSPTSLVRSVPASAMSARRQLSPGRKFTEQSRSSMSGLARDVAVSAA
jgi:hypothetical protein